MSVSPNTRRARRARVARADLFALRAAFVTDSDAEVREAALLRLDESGARQLLTCVRDATNDPSMLVRAAAFVALARAKDVGALDLAERACRRDRGFRVRRAALLFAARVGKNEALPILALASHDPFWRVRVAARRAGAALDATVDLGPRPDAEAHVSIPEIDDADPAVMTSRLMRAQIDPQRLVPLLGHSHQALRRLAVKEIAARADVATLREVLTWLRDPRVPYGPNAAEATLGRSGSRAGMLATNVLRGEDEPAYALAWAMSRAEETPPWPRLVTLLEHADPEVRRAATTRLAEAAPDRSALLANMADRLTDVDDGTKLVAATWLARSGSRDARQALLAIDPRSQPSPVRALVVDALHQQREVDRLRAFLDDAHGGVRAAAVAALFAMGALSPEQRRELAHDPDPWVRGAIVGEDALPSETTEALLHAARDPDPGVRSAAVEALDSRHDEVAARLEAGALSVSDRMAAYTVLRLAGVDVRIEETDAQVLAHVALLDDVIADRVPDVRVIDPTPSRAVIANRRELGKTGLSVQPFGLSGAHGLGFEDFSRAVERGVNLFFWEPSHRELTRFLRTKKAADTVVVAGTYHADAASIERDVVRTLRALRRDTIDVFLAFWTRSTARLDEVVGCLRSLSERGLIRASGVSTHDRALACDAADRGVDVVMVRHNAAHRGSEAAVFPHCAARGTGVLTFSNLCYGRMLHRSPASASVTAPDCYRYSLSRPGVHACIAAPRRYSELAENLAVVESPFLEPERIAELRAHGDHVYARSKAWSRETWTVGERVMIESLDSPASLQELAIRP